MNAKDACCMYSHVTRFNSSQNWNMNNENVCCMYSHVTRGQDAWILVSKKELLGFLGENLKSESSRVDIFEGLGEGIPLNMKASLFCEILKPHDTAVHC